MTRDAGALNSLKSDGNKPMSHLFPIFATFSPQYFYGSAAIGDASTENPRDSGDFSVATTSQHCGTDTPNWAKEITIAP